MTKKYTNTIRTALATACILLALMLANHFSDEVVWDLADFAVAGVLLFGAGLAYEIIAKQMSTTAHRVAVAIAIGIVFLLIWAELAVGIFGTPFAGS